MHTPDNKTYIAIDLKSFYASVECIERNLDPLTTNLVVADESRTEKTICLAVSPALKSFGVPGRPRLFEVIQKVKEANRIRAGKCQRCTPPKESYDLRELKRDPALAVSYIVAPPRMAYYMEYSMRIYQVYLKYIAPEDIHVYSIDEVFIDATQYLKLYGLTAHELAVRMVRDVLQTTGITATAGIAPNLYLCKIAMDIVAKHVPADKDGVRIAELDEMTYRKTLWDHKPLTDFWRVGRGYAKRLEAVGIYTMGDIARCSIGRDGDYYNEELLYRLFGINAELLIDHAWGWEPCTIADIKAYKPESSSVSAGQVLQCPYEFDKAKIVVREMADGLVLDLVSKRLVCDQVVLTVGYDIENLADKSGGMTYRGEVTTDRYGRKLPKQAHGSIRLGKHTSSTELFVAKTMELFDQIVDKNLLVRRMYVVAAHVLPEDEASAAEEQGGFSQLELFTDYDKKTENDAKEREREARERRVQEALLKIKGRFGKNAVIKGTNLQEGATGMDRNKQIGGHRA
ncbi:MAG: DNA methylase [Eubacteriales bacterium]|nr:DNA methylase [Eubacteriales bacterium]